jgi:hypothetical protein
MEGHAVYICSLCIRETRAWKLCRLYESGTVYNLEQLNKYDPDDEDIVDVYHDFDKYLAHVDAHRRRLYGKN